MLPRTRCILSLLTLTSLVACSSDDSSNATTDREVAKALASPDCYVGFKVSGVKYSGAACSGSKKDSNVSAIGPDAWDDMRVSIALSLNEPPALGVLDVASLTIQIPEDDDTMSSWSAPLDACTVTATDTATDDFMEWVYYAIDIACTKPATPTTDTTLEPLTLNQFTIVTFFAP